MATIGCFVNGDVPLSTGKMLRIYIRVSQREGETTGAFSGSIQIVGSPDYLDRPAVKALTFPAANKCHVELEGRVGRTRSTVVLDLVEGTDTVLVNGWKGAEKWFSMKEPLPIRTSETDPSENSEYVTLYPPVVIPPA